MVVSGMQAVNRQVRSVAILALMVIFLLCFASSPAVAEEKSRHQGEILGLNRPAHTLTLRNITQDGKKLVHFNIDYNTKIFDKSSGKAVEFEALKAGQRIKILSERRDRKRWAVEIEVKSRDGKE
jgi:hypothetical protein